MLKTPNLPEASYDDNLLYGRWVSAFHAELGVLHEITDMQSAEDQRAPAEGQPGPTPSMPFQFPNESRSNAMSMLLRDQSCVFPSQLSIKEKDMPAGDRWGQRPAVRTNAPTPHAL